MRVTTKVCWQVELTYRNLETSPVSAIGANMVVVGSARIRLSHVAKKCAGCRFYERLTSIAG